MKSPSKVSAQAEIDGIAENTELAREILGISKDVPLSLQEMAEELEVTFYPPHRPVRSLERFSARLKQILIDLGATVVPYEDALVGDGSEKVKPGIAIIEQGEGEEGELAIHDVASLYETPLVALYEGPCPVNRDDDLQDKLDAIVGVLAWNLTHIPIFVEEDQWTICTMNGGVIQCSGYEDMARDVLESLISKLTAQVVPPKRSDITMREGELDVSAEGYEELINDFVEGASIWEQNGLMLSHTSVDELEYRNRFYKKIVSAYLDHRTGMSYGFLVHQLPQDVAPAVRREDASAALRTWDWEQTPTCERDGTLYACVEAAAADWIVEVPEVWVLSTRSGCEKTNPDPQRDIVRMGLRRGEVIFDTPVGVDPSMCRPSYDTQAILAHAMGNALVASVLKAARDEPVFPEVLAERGLAMTHWHGYLDERGLPPGYYMHGTDNPPVSCSTPQSAVFALTGKLKALERSLRHRDDYGGDVHVEPHHGTNMTGCLSLVETAAWVDRQHRSSKGSVV